MKSLGDFDSDSSEEFEEDVSVSSKKGKYQEIMVKKKMRAVIADCVCSIINYLAIIPTLVYNSWWIIYIKTQNTIFPEKSEDITCTRLLRWRGYVLDSCVFGLCKSVLFLFMSKFCCGNENDLNLFCFLLKSTTSLLPSLIFMFKLDNVIDDFNNLTRSLIYHDDTKKSCENLSESLAIYLAFERTYVLSFVGIFVLAVFGAILAMIVEFYKSRGYKIR